MHFSEKQYKIVINYILGPVVFIWLSYAIYQQIAEQPNLKQSWLILKQNILKTQLANLLLVCLLMPVNWGFEAKKWQVLVKPMQQISFVRAFKAILSGQALALNTPNRIGEYAGRIAFLEEGNRLKGILLSLVANIPQIIITFLFGLVALVTMNETIQTSLNNVENLLVKSYPIYTVWVFLFGISLTLTYYNLSFFVRKVEKWWLFKRFRFLFEQLEYIPNKKLTVLLLLSLGRYIVFALQYLLLLEVFGVTIYWWHSFCLIAIQYLILACIPSIALGELGVRGQISITLFGIFSSNKLGIVATSAGIWFINLIIPAIFGTLFFLGVKIFKQK
ncbi:MAG: hypothetical protein ACOVQE_04240 [Chitinophagaceae bacterium]